MTESGSKSKRRFRRLLLVGIIFAVLGGTLVWLDRNPIHVPFLDDTDPEMPSRDTSRANDAGVLLVTSIERLNQAARERTFDRTDWSLGWSNLLEQECGHYAHTDVRTLDVGTLGTRRVIVVTASAIAALEAHVKTFDRFVRDGGVLILDTPTDAWQPVSGIRLGKPTAQRAPITDAAADTLAERVRARMGALPFPVTRRSVDARESDVTTCLAISGEPALVRRPLGRGRVVSTTFELGRTLVTIQQGLPESDFRVTKRWGHYKHLLESHDLAWDEAYLKSTVPAADVLERTVLAAARAGGRRWPTWWAFPDAAPGVLLMTHDEDEYGAGRCRLLLEHEKAIGAEATYFLITGRRVKDGWKDADVREFADAGADLALHWNRLPMLTGWWKLEPVSRAFSLASQVDWFRETLDGADVARAPILNRNHYLTWASPGAFSRDEGHYTRTFRMMHRHGIVMDSTYGPNRGGRGYLFGTGRPFRPLDVDGKSIPVWEMPFVSQEDWGGEDEAWFAEIFRDSESLFHCAVCCIFHPHIIVMNEKGNRLWKSVYQSAAKHGHPAITFRRYYDFLEARRKSALRWRSDGDALVASVDARSAGQSLVVAGTVARVTAGGATVDATTLSIDGLPHTLIPVPPGKNEIRITFR